MKKLVLLSLLVFANAAIAGGEVKEVCTDKKDKSGKVIVDKQNNPVQECKKIKVHKKLEGTEVPVQKK